VKPSSRVYRFLRKSSLSARYSPFSLVAEKRKGEETYSIKLICSNLEEETVERRVTFIRMLIVSWEAEKN
jgi:hypothetical protein